MVRELRGLCITNAEYDKIQGLLDRLKKEDDRVPKDASLIDYITRVIIPNGITLTESETARRESARNPRLVATPDEYVAERNRQYVGTRTPTRRR
jgi:hypothetical protein